MSTPNLVDHQRKKVSLFIIRSPCKVAGTNDPDNAYGW